MTTLHYDPWYEADLRRKKRMRDEYIKQNPYDYQQRNRPPFSPLGAPIEDPRAHPIGSHPAEGYYGIGHYDEQDGRNYTAEARADASWGRLNRAQFELEQGPHKYGSSRTEQYRPAGYYYDERTFVPGYQRTPELRSDQFYPTPTISHAEQEALNAENANRAFKQGVRNRLMTLMMGRMNR